MLTPYRYFWKRKTIHLIASTLNSRIKKNAYFRYSLKFWRFQWSSLGICAFCPTVFLYFSCTVVLHKWIDSWKLSRVKSFDAKRSRISLENEWFCEKMLNESSVLCSNIGVKKSIHLYIQTTRGCVLVIKNHCLISTFVLWTSRGRSRNNRPISQFIFNTLLL